MPITPVQAYRMRIEGEHVFDSDQSYTHPESASLAAMLEQHLGAIRDIDQKIKELAEQFPETGYPRRRYLNQNDTFPVGGCFFWNDQTHERCEVSNMAVGRRVAGCPNTYYVIEAGPESENPQ